LVALLTDAEGNILGVQLGYLIPGGKKSVLIPQRAVFWIELDSEKRRTGLFRIPPMPRTADDADVLRDATLVTEGAEKAFACHLAFPFLPVLGVPGIGRLRHIPPIKGNVLIICDGDEPGSRADKSLIAGIDHLYLTGTTKVRAAKTPLGTDADAIVLADGIEVLRQLMSAAPEVHLSGDGEA
jgi:hypothetical protein